MPVLVAGAVVGTVQLSARVLNPLRELPAMHDAATAGTRWLPPPLRTGGQLRTGPVTASFWGTLDAVAEVFWRLQLDLHVICNGFG